MEIDRSIMTGSGHWAFMQQSKELFVNNCSELLLSGEVNPIFQSLSSPGSTQGEFPVHVRVIYEDVSGERYMYQVGVHYNGNVQTDWLPPETDNWGYPGCPAGPCAAYETYKVDQEQWYSLPALNLMDVSPRPHKLISFRLGSSGHRFTAKFDNVQLTGSDAETCGTETETEAPSVTDAGIADPQPQMDAGVASHVTDAGIASGTTDAGTDNDGEVMSANSETNKLAVSQNHACAIDSAGSLKCWRFVGNLSVGWESEALDLQNGNGIYASVSAGWMYIHAITTTGILQAWDSNGSEVTLETMQTSQIWNAVRVNPIPSDNAVPMACGIHSNWTQLMCWGEVQYAMTYTVPTDDVWVDLEISGQTACALNASNDVFCWNVANPSADTISPEVSDFDWSSISYGGTQVCGLDDIGNVDCWNASNVTPALGTTHELLGWTSLALGDGFRACGIRDGQMQCWEYRNNVDQEALPESFGLPDNAVHVVMQSNRVCAVLETGALFCWGWEYDSNISPYLVPLPVLDGLTVAP